MAISQQLNKNTQQEVQEYRGQVLKWYDRYGRELPWRYKGGEVANPYHVWLSEIMCQQTTVAAVIPYYNKFLSTWPRIENLANATVEEVMAAWAGLGYYARARNLHKCAKVIVEEYGGRFPETQDELKKLPGIGDYTSAAIATIAFHEPATVMDGNIERIMARFFMIEEALPKAKPVFKAYTSRFFEGDHIPKDHRGGDFAQALMDIGASICVPKAPKCTLCPLQGGCTAFRKGGAERLPYKTKLKKRPQRFGEVYWVTNANGEVLFHRRPASGLLGGMLALPTSEWGHKKDIKPLFREHHEDEAIEIVSSQPKQHISHVFTHFDLTLTLQKIYVRSEGDMRFQIPNECFWALPDQQAHKLPTVFKKAFLQFID